MRLDCYQFIALIRPKQLLVMHLGTIGFLTLLSNAVLQPNLRPLRVHSFVAHSSHTRKRAATSPDKRVHTHTHTHLHTWVDHMLSSRFSLPHSNRQQKIPDRENPLRVFANVVTNGIACSCANLNLYCMRLQSVSHTHIQRASKESES